MNCEYCRKPITAKDGDNCDGCGAPVVRHIHTFKVDYALQCAQMQNEALLANAKMQMMNAYANQAVQSAYSQQASTWGSLFNGLGGIGRCG